MSAPVHDQYVLSFYIPQENTTQCTSAIFKTGAGTWPGATYAETCFTLSGRGQFRPMQGANPHIGSVGNLEMVKEDKVEIVVFGKETVVAAVKALRESHPYEVVAYHVVKAEAF